MGTKGRGKGEICCGAAEKKSTLLAVCRLFQRLSAESKIGVDTLRPVSYYAVRRLVTTVFQFGAIAQLGERLHGMQEVSGSIPLSSTKLLPNSLALKNDSRCGGIAQLGERLHGMQEVSGSIPLISTKFSDSLLLIFRRLPSPDTLMP